MAKNELAAIVLAAGLGTRMKSKMPKVLCEIKGKPMVLRSVGVAVDVAGPDTVVVVGHQASDVKKIISKVFDVKFAYQKEQIGTGHAVLCSIPFLSSKVKDVVILCGDIPLLSVKTIRRLILYHNKSNNDISVLAAHITNPKGYGRIMLANNGSIDRIVEEADASEKEKKTTLTNTGIFCVKYACLEPTLKQIERDNTQKEMYLTDIIKVGNDHGLKVGLYISSKPIELMGVNTLEELFRAEALLQYKSS